MNCLIVLPPQTTTTPPGPYNIFPVGIGYISAALKQKAAGLNLMTINLNHVGDNPLAVLKDKIVNDRVNILLVGGLSALYRQIKDILRAAKEAAPSVITVVGGGIITGDPEAAMEALEQTDYGIIGEGEETVVELCLALKEKCDVQKVAGLIQNEGTGYRRTESRPPVSDINLLPWCDYDGFDFDGFMGQQMICWPFLANVPEFAVPVLTARSCRNRCTFCFHQPGATYRPRNLDDFFAELDHLLKTHDIPSLFFVDEMVGFSLDRLTDFCSRIRDYGLPWRTSFRVVDLTPEKAALLKWSGCKAICLGLESASNKILKSMKKGITVEMMERALRIASAEKLVAYGNFILGDPEETYETCLETLQWALDHPHYYISLSTTPSYIVA